MADSNHEWDNDGELILTGSANAYVAATARSISGYFQGLRICAKANFTNSGASTLNINEIGAVAIRKGVTTALASGDVTSGKYYDFLYDATNSVFQLLNLQSAGVGSGDVVGPASSVDNSLAAFDGTTGKLIKDSGISIANVLTEAEAAAAYQPLDSDLTAIAALATAAYGRGLLTLASAAALGAELSGIYQPLDADLTELAAIRSIAAIHAFNFQNYR